MTTPDDLDDQLAKETHTEFAVLLERLLPEGVPDHVVASVLAGMCGAIVCELWDRCDKRPEDVAALQAAWRLMGDSIITQLKPETMQ